MDPSDVVATIEDLAATDVDCLDRDELEAVVGRVARVRAWLDAYDVRCTRRTRALAAEGRSDSAETVHGRHGGRSSKESIAVAEREAVTEQLPSFEDSLADGQVSAGHLDAIANALRVASPEAREAFAEHEAALLAHAANDSVDTFTRRCRELVRFLNAKHAPGDPEVEELERQKARSSIKRWTDKVDGMAHTHITLDPLRDATFHAALNRTLARMCKLNGNRGTPWQQMQVTALLATVLAGSPEEQGSGAGPAFGAGAGAASTASSAATPAPGSASVDEPDLDDPRALAAMFRRMDLRQPEATLLIDLATLISGLHERSICETDDGVPLPVATVRRMCCDAEIIPAVLGGEGEVLDVGRSRRTVTPGQRRALRAMHRTCAYPSCTVPFSQTKAHHVEYWTRDNGPTDIDNLLPLCEQDHHRVHEGRWTVTMTPDRVATWMRPDGSVAHKGSTIDRAPPDVSSGG